MLTDSYFSEGAEDLRADALSFEDRQVALREVYAELGDDAPAMRSSDVDDFYAEVNARLAFAGATAALDFLD